jgi:hypothetical protein
MLPNAHRAFVDPRKVRDYLLSFEHREGRYKAAFFFNLGYSRRRWARLHSDLIEMARTADAEVGERTPYGQKYVTAGLLTGASGRQAEIVAVWIIRSDEDFPRLVTVVPRGDR